MRNKIKNMKHRNLILSLFCVMMLSIGCGLLLSSYSARELTPTITIDSKKLSYEEKTPGSFRITKSAKWISKNQVKVTLDMDSISSRSEKGKDIIFVIDTSDAMNNEKILGVKKDLQNIIHTVLLDSNNRVVFVTYNGTSKIASNLTNDQEALTNVLDNITTETEERNYYQALKSVENILNELKPTDERDTRVVMITGGYPNKETPNETVEYEYLKEAYPNVPIYGVEYEIEGIEALEKVSDQVYTATRENLQEQLYEALGFTEIYRQFEIRDFINDEQFSITNTKEIEKTGGSIKVENNQILWKMNGLPSGESSKLEYILTLDKEVGGTYIVSKQTEIRYQMGENEEEITSTKTPMIGRIFEVSYDGNAPRGCTVSNVPGKERHRVYDYVEISKEVPICEGYQFEGWKNVTEEVKQVQGGSFVMPESDVTFRGEWSRLSISKSMDGEVHAYQETTIRKVNHIDPNDLWKYKDSIKKIVIQDYFSDIENAKEIFDISAEQNGGILVYIKEQEDGSHIAYIQGDGKIKANPDSSYLFDRFTSLETIEGMEYLDTSKVTNMSHMFGRCSSLKEIDLSHMDTSKVTDMSYMFHDCVSLKKVDLSSLDLSNVENMKGMFEGCLDLEEVDFPPEGIPNVKDVTDMFKDCPNLNKITPEELKIPDDTKTDGIFDGGNNLPEPPIKKEYKVEVTSGKGGLVFLDYPNIEFGKTKNTMVIPSKGYYLESFSCTNGYKNNAVIDITSSEGQVVTINNNYINNGSTCTATFGIAQYTIEYDLNGGTVEGENPTSYTIESENITLINPTKEGNKFLGWSGSNGEAQRNVTIPKGSTGNKNYTANFEAKEYHVAITKNSHGTISASDLKVGYGSSNSFLIIPDWGYSLESIRCTNGYTTNAKTGGSHTEAQTVEISNNNNDSDSNCTVTFSIASYTIEYDLDGGTVEGDNPTSYTAESEDITLKNPTKEGYTFLGWSGSNGEAQKNVTITKGSIGNKKYTANWEAKQYNVTFNKIDHGVLNTANIKVSYGGSNTFEITPNQGYSLESVSCTNGYTATIKLEENQTGTQTIEVSNNNNDSDSRCTATFQIATYKIDYHLDGGTVEGNPTSYTAESEDITLKNPTKEGYTFLGWSGSNGTTQTTVTIPQGSTGNKSYTANWEAKQYNVELTGTGHGTIGTSSIKVGYGSSNSFIAIPDRGYSVESISCSNGYTATAKEGEQQVVEVSNNNQDSDSNCTVTFSIANYTIEYNLDGGTLSVENPTSYTIESEDITLKNPTKTGYTFLGWSGSNGEAQRNVTIPKGSTGNQSYTANWEAKEYHVTFNKIDHGILNTANIQIGYGGSNTFEITPNPGYSLESVSCTNGYTTNAKVGEDQTETQTITVSNNNNDSDSRCSATFKISTYTIEYNLDGGTVEGNPTSYTVESETITLKNPTKEGYTFLGWSGSNGEAQRNVTIPKGSTGNKNYTAHWEVKQYNVELTSNDHGVLGTSNIKVEYGSSNSFLVIPDTGYSIESISCTNGYTTNARLRSNLIGIQTVEVFNNHKEGNSTCTVNFSLTNYTIEYNLDGGTVEVENPTSYTIESEDITLNNPTKTGYNFLGWSGSNGEAQKNVTIPTGSIGNKNYTANWEAKQYQVDLIGGDHGMVGTSSIQIEYGNTNTFRVTPDRGYSIESVSCTNGYTAGAKEGEEQTVEVSNNNNDSNSTCTVNFALANYRIEYNLDGGTVSVENPTSYTIESEDITLNNPTKSGYNFLGWSGSNGDNQKTVTIPKGSIGDKNYTANWEVKQYNVSITRSDHGMISTSSIKVNYAGSNTFTVTPGSGYYLESVICTNGYVTNAQVGSNAINEQEVEVSNNQNDTDSVCTVTFKVNTYTIEYDLNGGTVTVPNPESYTIESDTITLNNPKRPGYKFLGWTGSNGETPETSVTIPRGSTGNKEYTASWEEKPYEVTIESNTGGTTSVSTLPVNYGSSNTLVVSPTAGYYLKSVSCTNGYTNNAKTGTDQTGIQSIEVSNNNQDSDSTCTVSFSPLTYIISYNLDGGIALGNPSAYTIESDTITLKNPTKSGYAFTGWTGSNGETESMNVTIPKGSMGNKEYTAHYVESDYKISVEASEGGSVNTSNVTVTNGKSGEFTATPNEGYYLQSVSCTNGYTNNAKVSLSEQTVTVTVDKDNTTSTCTATFAENRFNNYLTDLGKEDTTNLAKDGTADDNLRYIGANPNNYVRYNNELWRVIGLMNNVPDSNGNKASHIKLIRAESIGDYSWNNNGSTGVNDWTHSGSISVPLNGAYLNRTSGTCPSGPNGATTTCNFSNIGLTNTARAQISNITWNLGGILTHDATVTTFYTSERGTTVYSGRPTTWKGYVGLMYPSDYGYAVGGDVRNTCLSTDLGVYETNSCYINDWLYLGYTYEFLLSSVANLSDLNYNDRVYSIQNTGATGAMRWMHVFRNGAVRPTVYLNTDIRVMSGTGTTDDPYTLESLLLEDYIKDLSKIDTTNLAYDGTVDNNLRYIGSNPNNYVKFNNELWRVIGVMNNVPDSNGNKASRVKLIRANSIGNIAWETDKSESPYGRNDWSKSSLKTYLNSGAYWTSTLNSTAKSQIGSTTWNLGGYSTWVARAPVFYTVERGTTVYSGRPTTWNGYVGLMYPSDYGYAVGGNARDTCLSIETSSYATGNGCYQNDWLSSNSIQWTITPFSDYVASVIIVYTGGTSIEVHSIDAASVRPVVYLNTNILRISGTGTSSDPFIIE